MYIFYKYYVDFKLYYGCDNVFIAISHDVTENSLLMFIDLQINIKNPVHDHRILAMVLILRQECEWANKR